jgi:hypothetical protein
MNNLMFKIFSKKICRFIICLLFIAPAPVAQAAQVVARPTASATQTTRARPDISAISPRAVPVATTSAVEEVIAEEITEVVQETPILDTARMDRLSAAADANVSANESDLKNLISAQRTADASSITAATGAARLVATKASGRNACNDGLRNCMKEKCGDENFTKCAGDSDLSWGDKMESCRVLVKCSGEEYGAFAPEIKADRDMFANLSGFYKTQDCGVRYNECIVTGCGKDMSGCLGKAAGDKVISDCKKIADECRANDSGLAARAMEVFGVLRQDAEKQVATGEKELYTLRDKMSAACKGMGAMFDERSFDCVFSVEFWLAGNASPFASRKAYAGSAFDCTQEWFGTDVTTYIENAARITREQAGASNAMLGAGAGTLGGVGLNAIMHGGFGTTSQQDDAEKAKAAYEAECTAQGGTMKSGKCSMSE